MCSSLRCTALDSIPPAHPPAHPPTHPPSHPHGPARRPKRSSRNWASWQRCWRCAASAAAARCSVLRLLPLLMRKFMLKAFLSVAAGGFPGQGCTWAVGMVFERSGALQQVSGGGATVGSCFACGCLSCCTAQVAPPVQPATGPLPARRFRRRSPTVSTQGTPPHAARYARCCP